MICYDLARVKLDILVWIFHDWVDGRCFGAKWANFGHLGVSLPCWRCCLVFCTFFGLIHTWLRGQEVLLSKISYFWPSWCFLAMLEVLFGTLSIFWATSYSWLDCSEVFWSKISQLWPSSFFLALLEMLIVTLLIFRAKICMIGLPGGRCFGA